MERRDFLKCTGVTALALTHSVAHSRAVRFTDKLCLNESTSMSHDFDVCMKAYSKAGIRHVEPWIHKIRPYVEKESIPVAKQLLGDLGLHAPCSCCMGELIEPREDHAQRVEQLKANLELVSALGIERFVVHSFTQEQYTLDDYKRGIENVRQLGEIGQEFGVIIVIEFIRMQRFMGTLPTALSLTRGADHPNVRPLFDFFHFWAGQGKMQDLDLLRDGELEHVHFHDAADGPREILVDKDRVFPGEGVIPMKEILRVLRRKKYNGYFSIELFDKEIQDADPFLMAQKAIETGSRFLT
ncbi:MAG TPA: sugar phosphate isomerase/epimerase family protein [bacterium]|nr:sugar phosphate isomerase/epimerase family protein [bacterium]